jgi:hypothetical protein
LSNLPSEFKAIHLLFNNFLYRSIRQFATTKGLQQSIMRAYLLLISFLGAMALAAPTPVGSEHIPRKYTLCN